ncbi:PREDICTED: synaptonemal complex protein 2 [Poecilia mexicana]|uniref:synaptonemal complex protein 2 n=1 Tax=Poecilia mexicana TaxID=48701 RepID=UPI00072EABB9|nr:PREDICTED: synaptonemal complex protein 2 [Poecilia mexicana]XP_014846927.1 PREDICTED: synaptonemal complex protein 2 [Poecilia mexicana]XP_014846932.1 PREDICTED: synaptonemal complex protein 2 [Poecilia mexicana]XP_014846939.1 PREDICTED: synaptonemal complex protein 2 [Poecilia mexicana]
MAPSLTPQLENIISAALKSGDVRPLDLFLERNTFEDMSIKCSQQFLNKLDKLVTRGLDQKETKSASLGLASLYKCGNNLKLPSGAGLSGLISQGLIKKMVQWFEKCRKLWIQHGPHWDETMFALSENFLNALMVVHESCKEGTSQVTESFLYPVGQLAVDSRINILIQKEAIRKYNIILDKIPVEFKKNRRILTSQDASDIMSKLAGRIVEGGDYDLQSSLMEALCRMATPDQRKKLADQWFSMAHVASGFAQIIDSEFETACRRFLNMVNGMQGDKRRVYSYPCLRVYLGKYELLMPSDEKLEEFWIDFNLGSSSISFYFSLPDEEDGHWETVCINENEVLSYTVTEVAKRKVLLLKLSEVVVVDSVEGSSLIIHFSSSLDILQAARSVFGDDKNKGTHVVKTEAKHTVEGISTQVVPESQVSLSENEKNTAPFLLSTTTAPAQMVTPARQRISESTIYISSSERGSVNVGCFLPAKSSTNNKGSTSLLKFSVCSTAVMTNSHNTTPCSTEVFGNKEQKIPVAAAEDSFLFEEKSQESNFVPDTQPRAACNTGSNWSKLSDSEMLRMPTQKVPSLSRLEPNSSLLEPQQRCPSSGQKLSVSGSSLVLHKQFHSELTERLQKLLNDRSKDPPPQESADHFRKASNTKRGSRETDSENTRASVTVPKTQRAQRSKQSKEKGKEKTALEADAGAAKASEKTITNKTVQNQKQSQVKDDIKMAISRRDKRDSEVTASMMKLISSRYETKTQPTRKGSAEKMTHNWIPPLINRSIFNMVKMPTCKMETLQKVNVRKSLNSTTASVRNRKDTFEFSADSPLSIGKENQPFTKSLVTSTSGIHNSSSFLITSKKEQPLAKNKLHVKKHLFSDTDTDNAPTDVSWLRESARKPKPQVIKYSRQPQIKPKKVPLQSPDIPPDLQSSSKVGKDKSKLTQEALDQPKAAKQAAVSRKPQDASKRPRRVAASSKKNYKEPDTDDSQSETETPQSPKHSSADNLKNLEKTKEVAPTKKKRTASKQPIKMKPPTEFVLDVYPFSKEEQWNKEENCADDPPIKKSKKDLSDHQADKYREADLTKTDLKVKAGNILQETLMLNKKNVIPGREQTSSLKDSLAACQTSFCPSPPFIEKMRSAGRSAPNLGLTCSTVLSPRGSPLPTSRDLSCQGTPSPIQLLPKVRSTVNSKGQRKLSSFYNGEQNQDSSKTPSVPSACSLAGQTPAPSPPTGLTAAEILPVQQHLSPVPPSLLSPSTQPLLTSTLLELDKPPVPSAHQSPLPGVALPSGCNLDLSKVSSVSLDSLSQSSPKSSVLSRNTKEKTPVTDKNLELTQHFVSGPARKRCISSSSNSEEDEKEEEKKKSKIRGQRSPRMKPRKLFKSFAEVSAVDEMSHISCSQWETEDMEEDSELPGRTLNPNNLCQQLSSELKNKFQDRCKIMEIYNKQSSKTFQQHISSIGIQLNKKRAQRVGQIQKVLLEEIKKMELDNNMLQNMEKDITIFWKKQMMTFHGYQKQETKRTDTLKKTLQSITGHNWDYEDGVFKSEMCLIKKDMKSIQDRLLSEMHEGEIQSVKRGLHALFFP